MDVFASLAYRLMNLNYDPPPLGSYTVCLYESEHGQLGNKMMIPNFLIDTRGLRIKNPKNLIWILDLEGVECFSLHKTDTTTSTDDALSKGATQQRTQITELEDAMRLLTLQKN